MLRGLSLIHQGKTIDAQNAFGLVSEIVDNRQNFIDHFKSEILDISGNHIHLITHYRQQVLPSIKVIDHALEQYFEDLFRSIFKIRKSTKQQGYLLSPFE